MVAASQCCDDIGTSIGVVDRKQWEIGAGGDAFAEARPQGMARKQRCENVGRTKLGTWRQGRERLRRESGTPVEVIKTKSPEVMSGRCGRPFEQEVRRVGSRRTMGEYGSEQGGEVGSRQRGDNRVDRSRARERNRRGNQVLTRGVRGGSQRSLNARVRRRDGLSTCGWRGMHAALSRRSWGVS